MTNKELAQKLLDLLGGKDNVLANAACFEQALEALAESMGIG